MITCNKDSCPIGVLNEFDLLNRHPERKTEIIQHGIEVRERRLTTTSETRRLLSWHPIHTVKIIFVSGLATFFAVWIITQISFLGHWYSDLKNLDFAISLPIVGEKTIEIGSHIPISTTLASASKLPQISAKSSVYSAILVMIILIFERIVTIMVQWKKNKSLKQAENELGEEIKVLRTWT
ncbi:hypothetical protein IT408_03190 [Candidatus Uhrbacteria bacterium]|nr:hypothetical protein [Candidatus Uhrbacteria bacterium]